MRLVTLFFCVVSDDFLYNGFTSLIFVCLTRILLTLLSGRSMGKSSTLDGLVSQSHLPPGNMAIPTTLDILLKLSDGAIQVPISRAATFLGLSAKTCANQVSAGTFPVRTYPFGNKIYVALADIADYIDKARGILPVVVPASPHGSEAPVTRKPGRPTKEEQLLRRQQAQREKSK